MKRFVLIALLMIGFVSIRQSQITQAKQDLSNSDVYLIEWSPDGSRVATSSFDGIRVYDTNFQLMGFFPNPLHYGYDPDYQAFGAFWSPDGTRLTAGAMILDAKTLQPVTTTKAYHSLAQWSPDGKYVSTLAIDYNSIERYDAQTGNLDRNISFDGQHLIGLPILSSDGSRFVLNELDAIGVTDATGKHLARYKYPYRVNALRLSPDGTRIAYQSTEDVPVSTPGSFPNPGNTGKGTLVHAFIIDTATGKTLMQSEPLNNFLAGFQWSPDGTQLSGMLGTDTMVTWDTATGQVIDSYSLPTGKMISAWSYSPYGARLTLGVRDLQDSGAIANLTSMPLSNFSQTFLDGKIQVIVPAPSAEKLESITQACSVQPSVEQLLKAQIDTNSLQAFTTEVSALTDQQIPPGCKADLLAVANALMAKAQQPQ
ncbi:MAG: WD40 repeat domain-containing protein [Chloroflexi bacterium]|nr:WD40 repeat domain-containing protein [Chloroflexota bacterium]MCC6893901.1 PD40 domain-containing protein [Anaerolineae bacterium]